MNGIGHDFHRTALKKPHSITKGLDATTDYWIGRYSRRSSKLRELDRGASLVEEIAHPLRALSEAEFEARMVLARQAVRTGYGKWGDFVLDAVAISYETIRRQTGMTPHHVQVMGALALGRGYLAEMATGEGKTLTVCLWAVVAGWGGFPVHVVTSNDYLAERDAEEMKIVYNRAGLIVDAVVGGMEESRRAQAYQADVVYTTSHNLLADFLKDRIQLGALANPDQRLVKRILSPQQVSSHQLVQRGLHTAIVDEADNVLVDEAVIPLRISRKYRNEPLRQACILARDLVEPLQRDSDYQCNEQQMEVHINDQGWDKIINSRHGMPVFWQGERRFREVAEQALSAREFFKRDKDYVIHEDKVSIVDGFSGRMQPDRSWSQGLHQAIEVKENVEMSDPTETLTGLSFQRFFRFFHLLSGLSGTAAEASPEFWQIYRLPVVKIPTHKPCRRFEECDTLFKTAEEKWRAATEIIKIYHATGRPVLIGTAQVRESEEMARLLQEAGLSFELLNAMKAPEEAEIISRAGETNAITIATNMAGRGTDIKLNQEVERIGGLQVLATERFESRRIDRQLFGRAGRHGDAGGARALISLEDDLIVKHGVIWLRQPLLWIMQVCPRVGNFLGNRYYRWAQKRAESRAFFLRKQVIENDTQTEEALSFAGGGL
jgi:preprotein translocase subunit SecA